MKVYEALAAAAGLERIEAIFAVMGDANKLWLSAIERSHPEIRIHYTRHENSAVAMADGYARATGRLGVCSVTAGPGLTCAATSLVTARRHGSPVLLLAGDVPLGDRINIQHIDQRRFVETLGATSRSLVRPDAVVEDFAFACEIARSQGTPVVLSAPTDVQEHEYRWEIDDAPTRAVGAGSRPTLQDPGALARAFAVLVAAERPIILAGRGAIEPATRAALEELAECSGALLSTTLLAKGSFTGNPFDIGVAGLFSSEVAQELFAAADCVLAVGASLNHYTTESGVLFPAATSIQVDLKPYAPRDGLRAPDCYVQGEALATVRELLRMMRERGVRREGYRQAETATAIATQRARPEIDADEPLEEPGVTMDPRKAIRLVRDALTGDELFVIGMGHFWWFPIRYLRWRPGDAFFTHDFGSIGQALPTGIGAAIGRPGSRVVVIEGDASILMCLQELDTAARYGVRLLVIVMNDEGVGAEYHRLRAEGIDGSPAIIRSPDLAAIARGFGAAGHIARTEGQLREALSAAARETGPCLIDVRIAREHLAEPYRRLWYPAGPTDAPEG